MKLSEIFLGEFDQEMANTRKVLERVPEDRLAWKPHQKSGCMGWLATHVATLPGWTVETVQQNSLDYAPVGAPPFKIQEATSRKELLDRFDSTVAKARAVLAGASDDHLMKPWTLLAGGKEVFTMPRVFVLRGFVMNHLIHHRAQLGVYLRLNDVPIPGLYGPSADEGSFTEAAKSAG